MRPALHPSSTPTRLPRWGPRVWLRCSSFKYSRYCTPPCTRRTVGAPLYDGRAAPDDGGAVAAALVEDAILARLLVPAETGVCPSDCFRHAIDAVQERDVIAADAS